MQSQPMHRPWEIDALTSSELLKSEQPSGQKTRSKPQGFHGVSWNLVEVNGIEPMTSCLQSRRSPN